MNQRNRLLTLSIIVMKGKIYVNVRSRYPSLEIPNFLLTHPGIPL